MHPIQNQIKDPTRNWMKRGHVRASPSESVEQENNYSDSKSENEYPQKLELQKEHGAVEVIVSVSDRLLGISYSRTLFAYDHFHRGLQIIINSPYHNEVCDRNQNYQKNRGGET